MPRNVEIFINERECEVEFEVYGQYCPETRWTPEEWPEIEVVDIRVFGRGVREGLPLRMSKEAKDRLMSRHRECIVEVVQEEITNVEEEDVV